MGGAGLGCVQRLALSVAALSEVAGGFLVPSGAFSVDKTYFLLKRELLSACRQLCVAGG